MDNGRLRVKINPNGSIDVSDLASGQTYRELLTFEDRADIGDGWYHGIAVNDEILTSSGANADIALIHDGFAATTFRVRITMNVPECFLRDKQVMRRSERLVPMTITSWLTLRSGCNHLEVHTEVDNTACDHRVRALVPTGLDVDTYLADSPYDVVERKVALRPDSHKLFEPELETKPQYSFTAVNDGKHGLAVVAVGQPESAVRDIPTKPIALTLFRSFARTVAQEGEPEGQMIGPTAHDYWIYPHAGAADRVELCRLGQRLAGGVQCIFTDRKRQERVKQRPKLPANGAWIKPSGGKLVFTACTQSEDGKAVIVRAFNPTDRVVRQRIELLTPVKAAHRANLLEEAQQKVTVRGRVVTIDAKAREIVTLRLALGSPR
jgi:alpha-mannosidase/mannosylglycerate hydrolase